MRIPRTTFPSKKCHPQIPETASAVTRCHTSSEYFFHNRLKDLKRLLRVFFRFPRRSGGGVFPAADQKTDAGRHKVPQLGDDGRPLEGGLAEGPAGK